MTVAEPVSRSCSFISTGIHSLPHSAGERLETGNSLEQLALDCSSLEGDARTAEELADLEPAESLLSTLAATLSEDVTASERLLSSATAGTSCRNQRLTAFHGSKSPQIPVKDYVRRIYKHAKCSPVCFVMAYIYIQRLSKVDEQYRPCERSVHRLLITGILIAAKLADDKFFSNSYFAKIGGISNMELNSLELKMLKLLDFRAFIGRPQILQQLRAMRLSLKPCEVAVSPAEEEENRRSKRRLSEGGDTTVLHALPAKLQHDVHHSQVLVTPDLVTSHSQAITAGGN